MRFVLPNTLLAVVLAVSGCAGMFFHPMEEHVLDPADHGIAYRDIWFEAADGVRLHGWLLPAETDESTGTVVFLHGNAENVSTHIAAVYWLPEHGFNVFLFDYRGFGRSGGRPDIAGVHRDAAAALEHVVTLPGVDPDRLAVFGQSLGASVSITVVAEMGREAGVRALVADSPFSSYRGIAREKFGGIWLTWPLQLPLSLTVPERFDPIRFVDRIAPIPLLIVVGEADRIVPPEHGRSLYQAARPPVELREGEGAGHIQTLTIRGEREYLAQWLRRWLVPEEQPPGGDEPPPVAY